MKQTWFIWLLGIALFAGALFVGTFPASAATFGGGGMMGGRGMHSGVPFMQSQVDRSAVENALLKGDYSAWKTALQSGSQKAISELTQDQFNALSKQAQDAQTKRTAIETAIKNRDYNAWKSAIGDKNPFAQKITASNFDRFAQMQELLQQARTIQEELGIGPRMMGGGGMGHFGSNR